MKQLNRYFIVEPGNWGGEPLGYSFLRTALKDFTTGVARDKVYNIDLGWKPGELHLTKRISLEKLLINEEIDNTITTKLIAEGSNPLFYLIRTYLFHTSQTSYFGYPKLKGYDVVKCKTISDCIKEANKIVCDFTGEKVSNLKNIFTEKLDIKLF